MPRVKARPMKVPGINELQLPPKLAFTRKLKVNEKAQTKDWAQFNHHETIVMVIIFRLISPDLAYKLWMVNKRITIPLEIMYRIISVDFFLADWIFRMPTL